MRIALSPLSFRAKLRLLVLLALLLGLLSSTGWVVFQQAVSYVRDRQAALLAIAQVFASTTGRATSENDSAQALEALRGIRSLPGIAHARISTDRGRLAEIGIAVQLDSDLRIEDAANADQDLVWRALSSRTVEVSVPVISGGRTVGVLTLLGETNDLLSKLAASAVVCAFSGVLALCIGAAVAGPLSRRLLQPLNALTATVAHVRASHDYTVQVETTSRDEVGILVQGFNTMLFEIARATETIQERELEIVSLLMKAAEHRDQETGDHVARVAKYVSLIVRNLGYDAAQQRLFALASTMHDVGKLAIPDSILLKAGPLKTEERRQMEQHTLRGRRILEAGKSEVVQLAAEIAESHHERWDGSGYPSGLSGEAIPIGGRAIAVADVFDALTSARPYKAPWSASRAKDYLEENAGVLFDPACVKAFLASWDEVKALLAEAANPRGDGPPLAKAS